MEKTGVMRYGKIFRGFKGEGRVLRGDGKDADINYQIIENSSLRGGTTKQSYNYR